jgi:hypothetical protein
MWAYLLITTLIGLPVLAVTAMRRMRRPPAVKYLAWPARGARFRAVASIEVAALTSWEAPFTGGEKRTLPAGEEFVVLHAPPEGATAVSCRPVRYEDLHPHFVRFVDRSSAGYAGYYLVVQLEQLKTACEPL